MRPSEALEKNREEVPAAILRLGAFNLWLFGSVARREDSDIDIMVDLAEGMSHHQVLRIEDALSDMLVCRVDAHVPSRPGSRFAERIKPDLKPL